MDLDLQFYGERAVLIQGVNEKLQYQLIHKLQVSVPLGFIEYVVGYSNMLFVFERRKDAAQLSKWLVDLPASEEGQSLQSRLTEVPVRYDGEDLGAVAKLSQLSEEEVVSIHCAAEYRVRMMGFSPGFPYLDGLDPRLHLDRRASPRDYIAPGAVAIGGAHAGIYSVASPGGWHLLGRTELPLFQPQLAKGQDLDQASAFTLAPGDRVKFVAISE